MCVQALADAQSAEQMQVEWLKEQMAPHFTQKLLRCTRDILKWIGAHDSDSKHHFPILAGSHLPEVTTQPIKSIKGSKALSDSQTYNKH